METEDRHLQIVEAVDLGHLGPGQDQMSLAAEAKDATETKRLAPRSILLDFIDVLMRET